MSRGATRAVFVEKSREHAKVIKANARELDAEACVTVVCASAEAALAKISGQGPFELVLADPPYDYTELQALVDGVAEPLMLAANGIFVLEHGPKTMVTAPPDLFLHSQRQLGPAAISVFTRRGKDAMLNP